MVQGDCVLGLADEGRGGASVDVVVVVLDVEVGQDEKAANVRWDHDVHGAKPLVDEHLEGLEEQVKLDLQGASADRAERTAVNNHVDGLDRVNGERHVHVGNGGGEAEVHVLQGDLGGHFASAIGLVNPPLGLQVNVAVHLLIRLENTDVTSANNVEVDVHGNISTVVALNARQQGVDS